VTTLRRRATPNRNRIREAVTAKVRCGPEEGRASFQAISIVIEIARKQPDQVGVAVHPRRWVVERFFAWIGRNHRHRKDHEATLTSARAFLYAASVMLLIRRLGRCS